MKEKIDLGRGVVTELEVENRILIPEQKSHIPVLPNSWRWNNNFKSSEEKREQENEN